MLALLAVQVASGSAAQEPESRPAKATEVLERTRQVSGTYALYMWNRITLPDSPAVEEWSAEFHSGHMHRVETPRDRVVADCKAGTGTALSLVTGTIVEGAQVALGACGIDRSSPIMSAEITASIDTPWGPAERLRIVDARYIRDYDVSAQGILLAGRYAENKAGEPVILTNRAVALDTALPEAGMFDRKSLDRSFVPERYRGPPLPLAEPDGG